MSSGLRGPSVSGLRANADWSEFVNLRKGSAQSFTQQQTFFDPTPSSNFITSASDIRIMTKIVASSSYTLTRLDLLLFRGGTLNAITIRGAVYSDSAGLPNTLLSASAASLVDSIVPLSVSDWVVFTGMSAALTNGVTYWVGFEDSAGQGGPQVQWPFDTNAGGANATWNGSWFNSFAGNTAMYRTFS